MLNFEPRGPIPVVRGTEIGFDVTNAWIVLVDDVLYTGRSVRAALDALTNEGERFHVKPTWQAELAKVSEGSQAPLGAYNRPWR